MVRSRWRRLFGDLTGWARRKRRLVLNDIGMIYRILHIYGRAEQESIAEQEILKKTLNCNLRRQRQQHGHPLFPGARR